MKTWTDSMPEHVTSMYIYVRFSLQVKSNYEKCSAVPNIPLANQITEIYSVFETDLSFVV